MRTQPRDSSSFAAATMDPRLSRPSGANASGNVFGFNLRITSRGQGAGRPYETLRSWARSSSLSSSNIGGVFPLISSKLLRKIQNGRRAAHRVLVNQNASLNGGRDHVTALLGRCKDKLQAQLSSE